jgi:hypothetical protein
MNSEKTAFLVWTCSGLLRHLPTSELDAREEVARVLLVCSLYIFSRGFDSFRYEGHCYRLYSSAVFQNYFEQFSRPEASTTIVVVIVAIHISNRY